MHTYCILYTVLKDHRSEQAVETPLQKPASNSCPCFLFDQGQMGTSQNVISSKLDVSPHSIWLHITHAQRKQRNLLCIRKFTILLPDRPSSALDRWQALIWMVGRGNDRHRPIFLHRGCTVFHLGFQWIWRMTSCERYRLWRCSMASDSEVRVWSGYVLVLSKRLIPGILFHIRKCPVHRANPKGTRKQLEPQKGDSSKQCPWKKWYS